jgi:hypothetical protein
MINVDVVPRVIITPSIIILSMPWREQSRQNPPTESG